MYTLLSHGCCPPFTSSRYPLHSAHPSSSSSSIEIGSSESEILITSRFAVLALVPPLFAVFALVVLGLVVMLVVALAVVVLGLVVLPPVILRSTTFVGLPAIFPAFTFAFLASSVVLLGGARPLWARKSECIFCISAPEHRLIQYSGWETVLLTQLARCWGRERAFGTTEGWRGVAGSWTRGPEDISCIESARHYRVLRRGGGASTDERALAWGLV